MNKLIKSSHSLQYVDQQNTSSIHNAMQCPCSQYIIVSQICDSISSTRKYFLQLFNYLIKWKSLIHLLIHNLPRHCFCFPEFYQMKSYALFILFYLHVIEIVFSFPDLMHRKRQNIPPAALGYLQCSETSQAFKLEFRALKYLNWSLELSSLCCTQANVCRCTTGFNFSLKCDAIAPFI